MEIRLMPWSCALLDAVADTFTRTDRSWLSDGLPMPYTRRDAESWFENVVCKKEGRTGLFRIILADGIPAGVITILLEENTAGAAEISYLLAPEFSSRGIMSRAVGLACAEAYEKLSAACICAQVFSPNAASCRVLEKNGFIREGRMPGRKGETEYDLLRFSRQK